MSFDASDRELSTAVICVKNKKGNPPVVIEVNEDSACTYKYKAEIMGMATKVPGFLGFSSFKIGLIDSDILLPMNEFVRLY